MCVLPGVRARGVQGYAPAAQGAARRGGFLARSRPRQNGAMVARTRAMARGFGKTETWVVSRSGARSAWPGGDPRCTCAMPTTSWRGRGHGPTAAMAGQGQGRCGPASKHDKAKASPCGWLGHGLRCVRARRTRTKCACGHSALPRPRHGHGARVVPVNRAAAAPGCSGVSRRRTRTTAA